MDNQSTGTVESIWVAPEGSAPMERREQIDAIHGGLDGDRYCRGTGYYSGFDECQVTLIETGAIETIRSRFKIDLTDGRHRRNIVTRGIDLQDALDRRLRIGGAELVATRPRPPCFHVAEVADVADLPEALGDDRGGICANVDHPGQIIVGDNINVGENVTTDPADIADAIRERYD